jgi:hypothetical protein
MREFKSRVTESDGSDFSGRRSLFAALGGSALIAALLVAATIGLTSLASRVPGPSGGTEDIEPPGSGITVETEVVDVWLPRSLNEFAERPWAGSIPLSDEALRLNLKQLGGENPWYALTCRHHQVNGRSSRLTTIQYPLRSAGDLSRFRDLFDSIDRGSGQARGSHSPPPRVHVIPDELLKLPPRDALVELLNNRRS